MKTSKKRRIMALLTGIGMVALIVIMILQDDFLYNALVGISK